MHSVTTTLLLCLALAALQPTAAAASIAAAAARPPTPSKGLPPLPPAVRLFFSLQNAKKCEAWADIWATDFYVSDPHGSPKVTTKAAMLANCNSSAELFTTVALKPISWYEAGDGVAVNWHCSNEVVGKNATCKLDFSGVDVFRTEKNGTRIASMDGYFDASLPGKQLAPCLPGGRK